MNVLSNVAMGLVLVTTSTAFGINPSVGPHDGVNVPYKTTWSVRDISVPKVNPYESKSSEWLKSQLFAVDYPTATKMRQELTNRGIVLYEDENQLEAQIRAYRDSLKVASVEDLKSTALSSENIIERGMARNELERRGIDLTETSEETEKEKNLQALLRTIWMTKNSKKTLYMQQPDRQRALLIGVLAAYGSYKLRTPKIERDLIEGQILRLEKELAGIGHKKSPYSQKLDRAHIEVELSRYRQILANMDKPNVAQAKPALEAEMPLEAHSEQ